MLITGTSERDTLRAEEEGVVVDALGGNDFIFNNVAGTTLIGGAGNDHYRLYNGDTTIIEELNGGYDVIWAYDHVVMPDNVEALEFKRTSNWYTIQGNALDNSIIAGAGDQAIAGGAGDDTMTGGEGRDQFSFSLEDGHDIITDFAVGEDILTFWDMGVDQFSDLIALASDTTDGLLFTFSAEQSVLLEGVTSDSFSEADVLVETLDPARFENAEIVFEDNFDSEASLTSGLWTTTPANGHPVTNAIARGNRFQQYVDADSTTSDGTPINVNPFSVEDGVLSITATRTPEALQDQIEEEWLSGSLETHGTFEQTYGYFEVRAKTPAGQGLWPAFWFVPSDYTWPPESDVLEALGSLPNVYRAATHGELWGDKVTMADSWLVPDTSESFHTYGVLWTPEKLVYTFDGKVMLETPTPASMHKPHSLHLNLALGGWDGDPDETTPDGASFDVDYVRVWDIPELAEQAANTDMSAYGDLENGILYTSEFGETDLYGDDVVRASQGEPDLTLTVDGQSTLVGTADANVLTGNHQGTVFNGLAGHDKIVAFGGADYLIGESGDDTLDGGQGADTLVGGAGDDTYILRAGDGGDAPSAELIIETAGEGIDQIVFADLRPDDVRSYIDWARWHIVVDGADGPEYFSVKVTPGLGGHDVGSYIEQVVFADGTVWDMTGALYLRGDDEANVSSGSVHDDTILGEGGDDTLVGMNGDDTIDGGDGVDMLYGWKGADVLTDSGFEDGDRMYGEGGNDTLTGGVGYDSLYGGAGKDTLRASRDADFLDGGAGDDTLLGNGARDTMNGGAGDDMIKGNGNRDWIDGGEGDDKLVGGGGNDIMSGGAGNDVVSGGTRHDLLYGDDGNDKLVGQKGDDTLYGGEGRDVLTGGEGADLYILDVTQTDDLDFIQGFDQSEGDRFNIIGLTAGDILSFDVFEHQNGNIFLEVDINGETTRLAKITDFVASDLTVEMLADQTEAYLF
ncbi:family 16 glycosylhydrolase [Donghicola eburneus]|uniref:family 16 glycosylhydrolase n=1 Tax=Donghicola eburneus TaxID=393278 RepID=UPI0008E03E11|nr:family 16 glycosylhydrolase [Donghicola eburneus]SFQ11871.1 Hemolysin-type calcium-binding repeat-containing protein [Donghicola eburneus]